MALPLLALAAGASALSSLYGGYKASKAYQEQAKTSLYNAAFARMAGIRAAERARYMGRRRIGEQEVAYAKGGVAVDSGTPLQMYADTAIEAERAAQEMLVDAQNREMEYSSMAAKAKDASGAVMLKGGLSAIGSILTAYGAYKEVNPGPMGGLGDTKPGYFDTKPDFSLGTARAKALPYGGKW